MNHPGQQEVEAINALTKDLMNAISFQKGEKPNISSIKNLFVAGGLLINCNEEEPQVLVVDAFIEHFEALFQQGQISSLHEVEVHHKTKVYDHVAHRFSFYEARTARELDPFAIGINTLQFVKTAAGWKISSMAWNDDNRGDGFFDRTIACLQKEA